MPDPPAVSWAQLSPWPAPSGVITPMPVTTTTGCPFLPDAMQASSADRLDKRHALSAPVADGGHRDAPKRAFILPFDPRGAHRRGQLFAAECARGKRHVRGAFRLRPRFAPPPPFPLPVPGGRAPPRAPPRLPPA